MHGRGREGKALSSVDWGNYPRKECIQADLMEMEVVSCVFTLPWVSLITCLKVVRGYVLSFPVDSLPLVPLYSRGMGYEYYRRCRVGAAKRVRRVFSLHDRERLSFGPDDIGAFSHHLPLNPFI